VRRRGVGGGAAADAHHGVPAGGEERGERPPDEPRSPGDGDGERAALGERGVAIQVVGGHAVAMAEEAVELALGERRAGGAEGAEGEREGDVVGEHARPGAGPSATRCSCAQ
jgi:hypothetical protein